jgi:hypothetical protein
MINYRILPEKRLIVLYNWGVTPVEEVLRFGQNLQADPAFSQGYDVIIDTTHLERQYTTEEIHRLSESRYNTSLSPSIKVATIAPADVTYGMSRMYQIITDHETHIETCVFRDTGSALKWLDREMFDIEKIFEKIRGGLQ